MTGLAKAYKTDKTAEVEGTPIVLEDSPNDDGTYPTFLLARAGKGNEAYTKALDNATRPYRRQMELKTFKNDDAEKVMMDVFLATILKGWENVQDEHGQPITFNRQAAKALMEEYPDLYERLNVESGNRANYAAAVKEAEAKN